MIAFWLLAPVITLAALGILFVRKAVHAEPLYAPGAPGSEQFVGIVTDIRVDAVMAQVELQCGPFRVVSLMSSEAVHELGLEPGSAAVAVIKSTNVVVETAGQTFGPYPGSTGLARNPAGTAVAWATDEGQIMAWADGHQ